MIAEWTGRERVAKGDGMDPETITYKTITYELDDYQCELIHKSMCYEIMEICTAVSPALIFDEGVMDNPFDFAEMFDCLEYMRLNLGVEAFSEFFNRLIEKGKALIIEFEKGEREGHLQWKWLFRKAFARLSVEEKQLFSYADLIRLRAGIENAIKKDDLKFNEDLLLEFIRTSIVRAGERAASRVT
jgi:hypothetical protein